MNFTSLLLYLFLAQASGPGNSYYLSPTGNDANDGQTERTAWRSLDRINRVRLRSGDRVLLQGGGVFEGQILLDENDRGTARRPIVIDSYGRGRARLRAGKGTAITVHNTDGISIGNLDLVGDGVGANTGNGVELLADDPALDLSGVRVAHCLARGFGGYGFLVHAQKSSECGFDKVTIQHCAATENGEAGIGALAFYPAISHHNLEVLDCKAYLNRGILTKTAGHSGNGIVLGGVDGALIARCEAWKNGADNRSTWGGPVGIWLWCCRNGRIEHSESHDNFAGLAYDGGGFDLDGGCENCSISHCRSWSNEGAGYLLCEFGSLQPFRNNLIEHNTSRNDGLKNSYGGITVSAPTDEFCVTTTIVRHNKVYVSGQAAHSGKPAAVYLYAHHFRSIDFSHNLFQVGDGASLLRCDTLWKTGWTDFRRNRFQLPSGELPIDYTGKSTVPDEAWRKALGME